MQPQTTNESSQLWWRYTATRLVTLILTCYGSLRRNWLIRVHQDEVLTKVGYHDQTLFQVPGAHRDSSAKSATHLLSSSQAPKDFGHSQCIFPHSLLSVHGHCSLPFLCLTEMTLTFAPRTFSLQGLVQQYIIQLSTSAFLRKEIHL